MNVCRNGLHEIDPADSWRASNGARCHECYLARNARYDQSEKGRGKRQDWYYSRPGLWHCEKLLKDRRRSALKRRAARHERMESERQRWRDEDEARA
jgi:hypothetical protein